VTASNFFSQQPSGVSNPSFPYLSKSQAYLFKKDSVKPLLPKTITRSPTKENSANKTHHPKIKNQPNLSINSEFSSERYVQIASINNSQSRSRANSTKNQNPLASMKNLRETDKPILVFNDFLTNDLKDEAATSKTPFERTNHPSGREPASTKNSVRMSAARKKTNDACKTPNGRKSCKSFGKKKTGGFKKQSNDSKSPDQKEMFLTELTQKKINQFDSAVEKMKKTLDLALTLS
jgi:hypothetical protein